MMQLKEKNIEAVSAPLFGKTIKSATSHLHVLLESNSLLSAIVSPQATLRQYHCYLTLMQHILSFYEEEILPLLSFEQRNTTSLIAADLRDISYSLPPQPELISYDIGDVKTTIPFAWGFAYVMEGSKLGGKTIFKNIQGNLGFSARNGARFISDGGANTYVSWKEWMCKLSNYAAANNCEEEIIQGAKFAFESVYTYFELNRLLYED